MENSISSSGFLALAWDSNLSRLLSGQVLSHLTTVAVCLFTTCAPVLSSEQVTQDTMKTVRHYHGKSWGLHILSGSSVPRSALNCFSNLTSVTSHKLFDNFVHYPTPPTPTEVLLTPLQNTVFCPTSVHRGKGNTHSYCSLI